MLPGARAAREHCAATQARTGSASAIDASKISLRGPKALNTIWAYGISFSRPSFGSPRASAKTSSG